MSRLDQMWNSDGARDQGGQGLLCAVLDDRRLVVRSAQQREALLVVSGNASEKEAMRGGGGALGDDVDGASGRLAGGER